MSDLFIRIYLDEDVNVLVADLLKARGFDAITARDAEQLHASDEEQLTCAVSQRRALLTHNRTDFEELIQAYFNVPGGTSIFGCPDTVTVPGLLINLPQVSSSLFIKETFGAKDQH